MTFSDFISLHRHSKRMMLLSRKGRKDTITKNKRFMIQYIVTKNINEKTSTQYLIPLSRSLPDFLAYPHPVPYPQLHNKQAAAAEPRSAAEPAHSGFLESPVHYPQSFSPAGHPPLPRQGCGRFSTSPPACSR